MFIINVDCNEFIITLILNLFHCPVAFAGLIGGSGYSFTSGLIDRYGVFLVSTWSSTMAKKNINAAYYTV